MGDEVAAVSPQSRQQPGKHGRGLPGSGRADDDCHHRLPLHRRKQALHKLVAAVEERRVRFLEGCQAAVRALPNHPGRANRSHAGSGGRNGNQSFDPDLLVKAPALRFRLDAEILLERAAHRLVVGERRAALTGQRQQTDQLAAGALLPRIQRYQPSGVSERLIVCAALLMMIRHSLQGCQHLPIELFALQQ